MTDPSDPADDPIRFVHQLQAEIEAEAERRRLADPELRRLEREIERAWVSLAPPGAAGSQHELLLDRAERLSMIDVDAPVGTRLGVRHIKSGVRKATYWYLRYVTDQLNALHHVLSRLLRRLDHRITRLEHAVDLSLPDEGLVESVPEPSPATAVAIVEALDGAADVLALSCRGGSVVVAAREQGLRCYGVDADAVVVAAGVHAGLDVRVADPVDHLAAIDDQTLGGVVLAGLVESLALAPLLALADDALRATAPGGVLVVAVADPSRRNAVEAELLAGRGLSPDAWAHVFDRRGCDARIVAVDDARIDRIVVAHRP